MPDEVEQFYGQGVEDEGYKYGTATDLSRFPPAGFNVALLMGPLCHLLKPEKRQQAVREACRIISLIFATFIPCLAERNICFMWGGNRRKLTGK